MGKALVIVESPTKEKTISKFLGKDFIVRATFGHVRDLPARKLGVDEGNDFEPQYVMLPRAKKVIAALKSAAQGADRVYLATDYDREGEAIAWHVMEAIRVSGKKISRISFHEITPEAIKEALANPRELDMSLINAQQARRILDRLVGYKLSPLLWKKVRRGLSAGRVQSVALRLIVEREREIAEFKSIPYWALTAVFQKKSESPFEANLHEIDGAKVEKSEKIKLFADDYHITSSILTDQKKAEDWLARIQKTGEGKVQKVVRKEARRSPSPPFMTSTLQQEASRKMGFSAVRTMRIAQQLYEGMDVGPEGSVGLITYMRTDSLNIAASAQKEALSYIQKNYGKELAPQPPRVYKSKTKGAQEAHEAIRPTSVARTPQSLKDVLNPEQFKLYDLIWRRFLASQMVDAVYDTLTIDILVQVAGEGPQAELSFRASGRTVKFAGFLKVYEESDEKEGKPAKEEEEQALPQVEEGDALKIQSALANEHSTEPPPRYNEASLIKMLEHHGIGRPSTYAPILQTIISRGYVRQETRRLYPTEVGEIVTTLLKGHFEEIVNLEFTAKIEERLDEVAEGTVKWPDVIRDFYTPFMRDLETADEKIPKADLSPKPTSEICVRCQSPMVMRESRFGKYLSCSTYPACKNKVSLDSKGEKIVPAATSFTCNLCGKPLVKRIGRRGPFLACSAYPECRNTLSMDKEGNPIIKPPPQKTGIKCEKCGKEMLLRVGKRGPFIACSGFPRCRNLKKAA